MMGGTVVFPELLDEYTGILEYGLAGEIVATLLGGAIVAVLVLGLAAVLGVWGKRKITAAFADRIAINRVGPWGLFIIIADAVRLLSKELVIPDGVDRPAWDLAPFIIAFSAMLGFAFIPFGAGFQLADPETGLIFVLAIASIASIGLVMAGYASNNKYSMLGGLRAVAQNIAYEIPLILTALSVVLLTESLRMSEIVAVQSQELTTILGVTIPMWFAIVNPFAFFLFIAANVAEVGRNPFDTPEAPTELVAGFQTEYSSVYFVLIYLGEFVHIFLGGAIVTAVFLGGGAGPVLPGPVWFVLKMIGIYLLTQWLRSAIPRFRIDQVLEVGWKILLVGAFLNLILTAVIVGVIT